MVNATAVQSADLPSTRPRAVSVPAHFMITEQSMMQKSVSFIYLLIKVNFIYLQIKVNIVTRSIICKVIF